MKRFLSYLVAIVILFSILAGCGTSNTSGKNSTNNASVQSSPATSNTSSSATTVNNTAKSEEISFLTLTTHEKKMSEVIKGFEAKYPNIKVKMELMPQDKLLESVDVRLSAKDTSIDVFLVDGPLVANYTIKGFLEPLDGLVDPSSKDKITTASLNSSQYKDQLMVLPLNSSTCNLYYNKDLFAKKGITPPVNDVNQRWTWEQVVDAAKKLTYEENGNKVYGFLFDQSNRPYQLLPLAQSYGAKQFISDDGLTSTGYVNSEASIKGAQFYYDIYNTWKISPKLPADQTLNYFTAGKVAMFVTGPWNLNAIKSSGINFGFAPHPYFKGGIIVTPTDSWMLGESKYSTKKESSAKFIQYTSADEGALINFQYGSNLPSNKAALESIMTDPKFEKEPDSVMRLSVYEAENTAMSRPKTPGYDEWNAVMEKTYGDIMNGKDPKKALDDAAAEIDSQLQKYKQ